MTRAAQLFLPPSVTKREMAAQLLRVSGASWMIRKLGTWNGLVVMNYHRVGDAARSELNQELWSATQDDLDAQIRFFKSHCDVIAEADVAEVVKRDKGRYLQLTFDDGYRDAHDAAFPVLKANGVSATFFLATGYLDQPQLPWWDEIAWMVRNAGPRFGGRGPREAVINTLTGVYRSLPPGRGEAFLDQLAEATGAGRAGAARAADLWLTWDMVRAMQLRGMSFGGHTITHCELAKLSRAEQEREIAGCKRRIEQELSVPMRTFSYPYGERTVFNADTRACLDALGVEWAYSYYGGYQTPGQVDRFDVKRFAIERDMSAAVWSLFGTVPWWDRMVS
jgi:peptidoglycan/xylan/chitin deacetylase (PgdA/CDA1 family)